MGWGDLGCYGSRFNETPNIDQLAHESLRFTQAYAGAPVCSPSRAAILTGQTPARLGLTQWIPGTEFPNKPLIAPPTPLHIKSNAVTVAQLLKKSGYQTAAIGKWHLGGTGYLPEDFGFDVNIGGDHHGSPSSYFGPYPFHNLTGYSKDDYLTDILTEKMEAHIQEVAPKGPFFLYMAEYAVHVPLQARLDMVEKYRRKNAAGMAGDPVYAAMIESVDMALGRLRVALKKAGVDQNTIIILTSDNGGVGLLRQDLHRVASNGNLRGGKGYLYEGGIREPLLVHWPQVTHPGSLCETPVIGMDFLPTMASIAGGTELPQPCDGINLTPLLHGQPTTRRDTLCWHYPNYSDQGGRPAGAIRQGDWKLIENFEDGHVELYNLAQDPSESFDLASSFSDHADDLLKQLHDWRRQVGAQMPHANPAYKPREAAVSIGEQGCSWSSSRKCRED
jgi:arylsulfatase A-like enzyme